MDPQNSQPDLSTIAGQMEARRRTREVAATPPPSSPAVRVSSASLPPHVPNPALVAEIAYQLEHNRAPVPAARVSFIAPTSSAAPREVVGVPFERSPLASLPGHEYSGEAHGNLFTRQGYEWFLAMQ